MSHIRASLLTAIAAVSLVVLGCAQPAAAPAKKVEYPTQGKTITMIVPVPPGGSMDVGSRMLAPLLEKDLGVAVQVVNKPGAAHQVGLTELAVAKPDGYTIGYIANPSTMVVYLDAQRKAVFTRKSFQPVAQIQFEPAIVAVRADSPHKTMKDLVDAAKANPEKVTLAVSGIMGPMDMTALILEKQAGVRFAIVHLEGGGPVITSLLGGQVAAMVNLQSASSQHAKAGTIRVLGIADKQQSEHFPGVPTLESQGYKAVLGSTHGIAVPAGTPRETVDILGASIRKALENPDVKKRMADIGMDRRYGDSERFAAAWAEMEADVEPLVQYLRK